VKLNFGCEDHIIDRWVNADRHTEPACLELGAVPIVAEELSLPWDDDTFDQVLMAHTIEHIPLDGSISLADYADRGHEPSLTVQEILAELYRVTKPGGSCLFIGPDVYQILDYWLALHEEPNHTPRWRSDGKPGNNYLLKLGALDHWLSSFVDPYVVNTRWHDKGLSSVIKDPSGNRIPDDKDAAVYSYNEMEIILETVLQNFLGNLVLENDIHLVQSDHRWNCYEERLFNLVNERFPTSRVVERPDQEDLTDFKWIDENEREWFTRSWTHGSCAVLATK
jgi:SAM-dependent methyltransferase